MNRTHESIKLAWEPVQNSGFHYVTEIERCPRNDTHLRSTKLALYPSGNHMNHTYFYENFLLDEFWNECEYTIHGMVWEQIFQGLDSGTAYRFRVRQLHNLTREDVATQWSHPKVLTTRVAVDLRRHEYSQLFLRGTGLNNFNASVFTIDEHVLLDHAFYIGLYLAVIDRRNLALVESGFYNTSKLPELKHYKDT